MKRFRRGTKFGLWVVVLTFAGPFLQAREAKLGQIEFPTSGRPEAHQHFLRGVLFLHSFEYQEARAEFQKAEESDPEFAMAYWGEAMTYNHPVWQEYNFEAGKAALNRLAPTPETRLTKAPTAREKGYLGAVEILYSKNDKKSRDFAYAEAMRRLTEHYPEDLEAASLYALALLGTCHQGRHIPTYMKAAAIAEEVFAKNSKHPGAAHYLIHSYDDPVHAPLGLRAARVYAKLAPAAVHAQHMPSHIFLALGMWGDVVESNEASWAAARQRGGGGYHSLYWLQYGYLQQGRYRDALKLLKIMEEDVEKRKLRGSKWHLASMRATYLIETQQWDHETAHVSIDRSGVTEVSAPARDLFAVGLAGVRRGDRAAAKKAWSDLEALHERASGSLGEQNDSDWYTQVRPSALRAAEIMAIELKALIRLSEAETVKSVELLKEATAGEDSMSFEFGPPIVVKPPHELLGEVLLELSRPQEARKHFEQALVRAPKRSLSLLGLARAASRSGDLDTAGRTYRELRRIWQKADPQLLEVLDDAPTPQQDR